MPSLREAAQQALEALEYGQHTLKQVGENQWESRGQLAMEALKAALEQPEQEPIASLMTNIQSGDQEVVWNDDGFDRALWHETPLYTVPLQRKPLTDEEIRRIDDATPFHEDPNWTVRFARAIERAHGIGGE